MPVDPKLLEVLACPVCKTGVQPTPDGAGLLCATCHRRFPVVDDIPIMLIEEAAIDPGARS